MVASVDDDASKTSMKISAGKKEGDNVVFYCQPNYDLVGERRANCTATGMWSHLPPKCIRGECVTPRILYTCMLLLFHSMP